jgi:hypothetical protein
MVLHLFVLFLSNTYLLDHNVSCVDEDNSKLAYFLDGVNCFLVFVHHRPTLEIEENE